MQNVTDVVWQFIRWLGQRLDALTASIRKVRRSDRLLAIVVLILWLAILLGNFYFRGHYIFEGDLTVQEMSFAYTGTTEKRFLSTIDSIQNLDLEGRQAEPLILTGAFSSDDETFNSEISKLDQLIIELPYATSRFIISPTAETDTSELSIIELRINSEIQVNRLLYQADPAQLSFCLQTVNTSPDACLFPDTLLTALPQPSPTLVGKLTLQLGQQPLNVSLGTFSIEQLGLKADVDSYNELNFKFTPSSNELVLPVASPTRALIELPTDSSGQSTSAEASQWLRGDIEVKNVSFARFDITDNVTDELKASTILAGEVRMGSEVMKIQENQFLVVLSDPGIQRLRYIQLQTKSPQGLRALVSGESKGIAVGFYSEFPVQSIEPSFLSKYLSSEAINALLAFIAAITGVLLPRLFPEPSKDSDRSEKSH